jgi:site-specific DNA recombinase
VVVVYKIDRLTRSLTDFSKLIEVFEKHQVSFVSVTQQFNTTTLDGQTGAERPFVLRAV